MTAIKVSFEIGHEASLRSKKTPEGFTHDWEVFVRGQEGADISHFVEKVVFHLHETFPRPRRVVKDPPFSIKESGYAGFMFPIEIYLKNKDEPKKITFSYDFTLQQSGFLKDRYVFNNPNEEFKKKLLKGGGLPVSNTNFYTNPDQESKSRDSFTEEKPQLLSKPKLSSENVKKHKTKEHKEEVPLRTSSFENLFGATIQKPPKVSPDPKKFVDKTAPPPKSDKKEKERGSAEKKSKHEHKESKPEKVKNKEDKDKNRPEKVKSHNKDQEKVKDKSSKRPIERPPTPEQAKKRRLSPMRKLPSPPPRSNSASSIKEEYKILKQNTDTEQRKPKLEEKIVDKTDKEIKEKKKKEKKSHDRDKERKEKKESKKENQKIKDSLVTKDPVKETPKEIPKARDTSKETLKETPPVKEKPSKPEKAVNKFSIENLRKTPPPENEEKPAHHKSKEKSDERKHKHKKKDKKRDESREKHKESSKERKHKHEKVRETPAEKPEVVEHRETPVPKERPVPELASPISLVDTASQCSSKSGIAKTSQVNDDINSSHSDSESSVINEEDEKPKIEVLSPEPINIQVKQEPSPEPEPEPEVEVEPEPVVEAPPPQVKEKSKKHKDKSSKREEKRRKRKAAEEEDADRKATKTEMAPTNAEPERGESSGSVTTETKVQDNGVSSSLGEDAEPGDLSPDYMVQLRDLQQRIMKIKNNEDLERVVNLIAETGRYEVTTQTFDFDLCLLDRSTVQQLIQLVGC